MIPVVCSIFVSFLAYTCRNASSICVLACHLVRRTWQFSGQLTQPFLPLDWRTSVTGVSGRLDLSSCDTQPRYLALGRWATRLSKHLTAVGPSGERSSGLRNLPFPCLSMRVSRSPEPTIRPWPWRSGTSFRPHGISRATARPKDCNCL